MYSGLIQKDKSPKSMFRNFTRSNATKPFTSRLSNRLLCLLFISLISSNELIAGTLDSFKKDVKKERSEASSNKRSGSSSSRDHNGGSKVGNFFGDVVIELLFEGVKYSALTSHHRVSFLNTSNTISSVDDYDDATDFTSSPRKLGDPELPFVQLEGQFHNVWGDTSALNYKATIGYGMFAYSHEQQHFTESSPDSELTITKQQWLLRLSLGEDIQIYQGIGSSTLSDNMGFEHEELLYTSPVKLKLSPEYMLEFTPTWTSSYDEYDVSLRKSQPFYSYKLGYKILTTGNTTLDGIYVGFSVQY